MEAILYFLVKQQSKREENYPQIGAAVSEVVAELDADDSLYHMPKGASESRKKNLSVPLNGWRRSKQVEDTAGRSLALL